MWSHERTTETDAIENISDAIVEYSSFVNEQLRGENVP